MIHHELARNLRRVERRLHADRTLRRLSLYWLGAGVATGAVLAVQNWIGLAIPIGIGAASLLLLCCCALSFVVLRSQKPSVLDVARRIEQQHPELGDRLLAAIGLSCLPIRSLMIDGIHVESP